jgi:hypothetical protein
MIIGYYSGDVCELRISKSSLTVLIQTLQSLQTGSLIIQLSTLDINPSSHGGLLTSLTISIIDREKVELRRQNGELFISGTVNMIGTLTKNLVFLLGQSERTTNGPLKPHIHIEYYDGHPYLSRDSLALIVVLDGKRAS